MTNGTDPAKCPLCGASQWRTAVKTVVDHVTGELFDLARCGRCAYVVTKPLPTSLDAYYPVSYRGFRRAVAAAMRTLYKARVSAWMRWLPSRGKVLEAGAGPGWMLGALGARGWTAIGSERSIAAATRTREQIGPRAYVGDLAAVRPGANIDLIIMFHVLEHLVDPLAALRSSAAALAPEGQLIIGVPNIASWQARVFGRHWFHLEVPRHVGHYERPSLQHALGQAGLRIERIGFVSVEHDIYGWVQSSLNALGFPRNLLTRALMRMTDGKPGTLVAIVVNLLLAVPLTVIALVIAPLSWSMRSGAIMEVWATRT